MTDSVTFWPTYSILKRQVKWPGSSICLRIFQFVVIHTVKGFRILKKAEVDVFLEHLCFLHDSANVGNLISGSSAFSKPSLYIWFLVHVLLKPSLKDFKHNLTNMWNKHSCIVCTFNRQVQLGQAGLSKAWCVRRMRNKMQEFFERQGSGDQHHSKVKVLKLNPGQLYNTLSCEGRNVQGFKL